jgi:hypothetical protein
MKRILLILLLTVLRAEDAGAAPGGHLFVLSGQSNMALMDADSSFTPVVAAALGADRVLVVKDAEGNRPIRCWYRGAPPVPGDPAGYVGHLQDRLLAAVAAVADPDTFATVTFVWMQGEKDACRGRGHSYADFLAGLIRQVRADLGRDDVGVVIGRIGDYRGSAPRCVHWGMVREAQAQVAEATARCAWVDTDDLNGDDDALHFTPRGLDVLGRRFARQALALIAAATEEAPPVPPTAPPR